MALDPAEILAALAAEYHDLGATGVAQDGCTNGGTGNGGRTNHDFFAISHHQHLVKDNIFPGLAFKAVDDDLVILGNTVLFATSFHHCIHGVLPQSNRGWPVWLNYRRCRQTFAHHRDGIVKISERLPFR